MTFWRTGSKVMRSPSDSRWRVSPGASCKRSRRGLGRTTRPALSRVSLVAMMAVWCGRNQLSMALGRKTRGSRFRSGRFSAILSPSPTSLLPWFLPSSLRRRGAAGELADGSITDILKVGDADFAGVEAVGGEIAEKGKEGHALAERAILFGIFPISDQVQDFRLLFTVAIHKDIAVTVRASGVQPEESAAKFQLIFRVLAGEEIDKFRRASLARAAGLFILGDDGVAQKRQRRVLRRGKIFRRVLPRRGRRFLLVHHLVDVLGGLRRDHLQHRSAHCTHGQRS